MTNITTNLWIGGSFDAEHGDLKKHGINALLNVAHDLNPSRCWREGYLYAQCGLVDGPGNTMAAYHAATLMLASMMAAEKCVLVYDHLGGRALAVALFYLNITGRRGWEEWLTLLRERHDKVKEPHAAHKEAFNRINWRLMAAAMDG